MMSFSAKTGAAVLRYSMAMASARAKALYCEPGSRAASAAGPVIIPAASPTTPASATTARRIGSDPQVRGEDLLLAELIGFAHELHAALVQDVHEVGQFEGPGNVLLHEEQRRSLAGELVQVLEDLVDDLGRQAHRHLVEEDGPGPGDVGPGQGQHLLLTAAHRSRPLREPFPEA